MYRLSAAMNKSLHDVTGVSKELSGCLFTVGILAAPDSAQLLVNEDEHRGHWWIVGGGEVG